MKTYHKIQSIYKRDPKNNYKTFLEGQWSVEAFGLLKDLAWDFTEKIDGTNIRIGWDDVALEVKFGGRTDNAQLPGQLVNYMKEYFTAEHCAEVLEGPVTLIGEGYGGKIQKGSGYRQEQRFILFDVFVEPWVDCPTGMFLERGVVENIAGALDIPYTPIVHTGPLMEGYEMIAAGGEPLLSWIAESETLAMEGFVARPRVELRDRLGRRIITKIKEKDFPRE